MARNEAPVAEAEGEAQAEATVDVAAIEAKVAEAQATLDKATATFTEAGKAGELKGMLEAADAVKAAQKAVERAKAELANATYSIRAEERMALAVELKARTEELVAEFEERARALSLTGIHVSFAGETTTVSVTDSAKPVGKRTVSGSRKPASGEGRARNLWLYQGEKYTSRELLLNFGGEEGALAVRRASKDESDPESWVNRPGKDGQPQKFGPGFDAPVKKLAGEIGATQVAAE